MPVSRLFEMKNPEIERVLRAATPPELRAFAVACGRLAVHMMAWDQPRGVTPLLKQFLDIAALMIQGVPADDPDIVEARKEARELADKLDDAQLTLHEQIDEEAMNAHIGILEHPRYPAYSEACYCYRAAEITAQTLWEDAFESAVECAYMLDAGMCIDQPTVLAIARMNIPSAAGSEAKQDGRASS